MGVSDEEIRREVLARNGWEPHEVDRYLAEHPKPDTLFEQQAILRERLIDVGRALWHDRATLVILYAAVALCCVSWLLLH